MCQPTRRWTQQMAAFLLPYLENQASRGYSSKSNKQRKKQAACNHKARISREVSPFLLFANLALAWAGDGETAVADGLPQASGGEGGGWLGGWVVGWLGVDAGRGNQKKLERTMLDTPFRLG